VPPGAFLARRPHRRARRRSRAALCLRLVRWRASDGHAEVKGALAVSGIYDLEPIRLNYLNEKLRLDDAEARRNSPLLHLLDRAAPLLVTVGGDELPELRRQSETYYAAWRERGLPGAFVPLPGRNHYSALEELARPGGVLAQALTTFAV